MIYLLGAGSHAKQVVDIFEENNQPIAGFFDDFREIESIFYNYPILGGYDKIDQIINNSEVNLFCCLGDNNKRQAITVQFSNYNWVNCISNKAHV